MQTKVNDLQAFVAVARDKSFTKAAAKLGITPSALSHTIRTLEERLGVRLLARTTRNVSTTEAGERLLNSISPLFDQIAAEVEQLGELRDKPAGTIRITCTDDAIELCLRPKLAEFLKTYPDIKLEMFVDYGFRNVVEDRFDAGIRMGEYISKDMIAVPIGPDWRLCVVGSPAYFKRNPPPKTPYELTKHACINIRHRPDGTTYAWEFERNGQLFTVKGEGQLIYNSIMHVLNSAVDGLGLGYVPQELVATYLADGRLKEVLSEWCPYFQGFHLYYPVDLIPKLFRDGAPAEKTRAVLRRLFPVIATLDKTDKYTSNLLIKFAPGIAMAETSKTAVLDAEAIEIRLKIRGGPMRPTNWAIEEI